MPTPTEQQRQAVARGLVDFLNASWTQFEAVAAVRSRLQGAGFIELPEGEAWNLQPGGKYFITRNMSTVVAFAVGGKYRPGGPFHVVGAHTDSPCLKLKPISKVNKHGFLNIGVQPYGGGLWHTWFDRDLTVGGRCLVERIQEVNGTPRKVIRSEVVRLSRPICRVPNLAIHLSRNVNADGFKVNLQEHMVPILATSTKEEQLQEPEDPTNSKDDSKATKQPILCPGEVRHAHHSLLVKLLAEQLQCRPEEIVDVELQLCDTQASTVAGAYNEFIYSGRLDNLCMCHCATEGLVGSLQAELAQDSIPLSEDSAIRMIALFDHEEVGSGSAEGAEAPLLANCMRRIATHLGQGEEGVVERALHGSFIVSADMAHALHPNYAEKHETNHQPKMHKGLVIKHNANQRYATNSISAHLFRRVGLNNGLAVQEFCVRSDMGCGSTIGPIMAAGLGVRTVDVGAPQLSMHSVREMMATDDVYYAVAHFTCFFGQFTKLASALQVDAQARALFPSGAGL